VTHSEKIGIEEETGEALNDAMFRRDKAVEERFDVTLVSLMENDGEAAVSAMKRSVTAGTDDYDCGFLHMVSASNAASGGYSEARLVQVKDTSVFCLCEFSVYNCMGEGAAGTPCPACMPHFLRRPFGADCPHIRTSDICSCEKSKKRLALRQSVCYNLFTDSGELVS